MLGSVKARGGDFRRLRLVVADHLVRVTSRHRSPFYFVRLSRIGAVNVQFGTSSLDPANIYVEVCEEVPGSFPTTWPRSG